MTASGTKAACGISYFSQIVKDERSCADARHLCPSSVGAVSLCLWLVCSVWWHVEHMLIWMPDLGQWPLLAITGQLRLVNLSQSGVASVVEFTTEQHHIHCMEQWFLPGCTTGWPMYTWLLSMHSATHTVDPHWIVYVNPPRQCCPTVCWPCACTVQNSMPHLPTHTSTCMEECGEWVWVWVHYTFEGAKEALVCLQYVAYRKQSTPCVAVIHAYRESVVLWWYTTCTPIQQQVASR